MADFARVLVLTAFVPGVLASSSAQAAPADGALLKRLADTESSLARWYATGDYTVTTHRAKLGTNGRETSAEDVVTRMRTQDGRPLEDIVHDVMDGVDVTTAEAAKRNKQVEAGRTRAEGMPFVSPFAATQASRYRFDDAGPDPRDPKLHRITFTATQPATDAYVGEALVDTRGPAVVSIHFHPTKRPAFVDSLEVSMAFDNRLPDGSRALSALHVDGEGGLLFYRQHVRVDSSLEPAAPEELSLAGPQ